MNLENAAVLITGGARMGEAIAVALAKAGADVALLYRSSRKSAETAAAAVRNHGRQAIVIQGDLADPAVPARVVAEVEKGLGRLNGLVQLASSYEKIGEGGLDASAWDRAMQADARGTFLFPLAAAPLMMRSGGGRIVNFADWVAASGRPRYTGFAAYYAAKKAVIGLTEALALDLAPDILVNAIAPGPILPPPDLDPAEIQAVIDATPLARWGGVDEIVKTILFLLQTDFITGETIRVDGGRHLR